MITIIFVSWNFIANSANAITLPKETVNKRIDLGS